MAEQVYQPRNPKASPLWRCVDAHFEEFLQVYSERYQPRYGVLRDVIPEVVGKFLECGDLEKGFARVRCPECRHEFLVAFSCKARWFCPSCHQKKVLFFGEFLAGDVLAPVPHRHWILALPKMLRPYFKFHRALLKDLCRIAHQCLTEYFRSAVGLPEAVPAAVMVIHTFGEYLVDFHPHLHALVADGLFDPQGGFHPLPEEIVLWALEEMFRRRVIAFLVDQELLPRDRAEMLLSWQHSGFSLHRSRRVGHEEREDLEQIARYILRNPFSTAKMHFEPGAGSVLYRSRMNKKQGGNFAALSPTDFIAAVTQHIPDKGFQLVRYYGWYSNKARGVRAKTGAAQAEDSAQGHEPDRAPTSAQWRRLIAKIWEADPLTCPDCGAEMRILAFIEEDRVIGRILRHLGLLPDASRGPPLQEPVYEPIYNDLPAVEEEDVVYQPF
jgi:putative transposase/transposase-like zinc-binding protein